MRRMRRVKSGKGKRRRGPKRFAKRGGKRRLTTMPNTVFRGAAAAAAGAAGSMLMTRLKKKRKFTGTGILNSAVQAMAQGEPTSGDRQQLSKSYGRKMPMRMHMQKFIRAISDERIYRYQALTEYGAAQGYQGLSRNYTGTVGVLPYTETMPYHIYELTNIATAAGQTGYTTCGYQVQRNYVTAPAGGTTNPQYLFLPLSSFAANGAALNPGYWTYENVGGSAVTPHIAKDILQWCNIKVDAVGPANVPCKWTMKIVSFTEEHYMPDFDTSQLTNTAFQDNLQKYQARSEFWDNETERLVSHPFMTENTKMKRQGMKVLSYKTFMTQPKESTDNYKTGQERMVKMFNWYNKTQNYLWSQAGRIPTLTSANEPLGWTQNFASPVATVHPRARIWLVIQAENTVLGATTADTCPSYDIVMKKKHIGPLTY